jgi:hypothetical protein
MMPHGVPRCEAQPAYQHQSKDETEQRACAERQLAIASRPLSFRFILVKVSVHE